MAEAITTPVLGFLGGVFGGIIAQGIAYFRRRKRHLDQLNAVLNETKVITQSQLEQADDGHAEMDDRDLNRLWDELKRARLQASYLLNNEQRDKIEDVGRMFEYISHSAGNCATTLDNSQLSDKFEKHSKEAIESLPRI